MASNRILLQTPAGSSDQQIHTVITRDGSKSGICYRAELDVGGTIIFTIRNNKENPYNGIDSDQDFKYLQIDSIFSYHGKETALFETVFKVSLANGCEGRINFKASRYLHDFLFQQGFRYLAKLPFSFLDFYLPLAEARVKHSDLNLHEILYLPHKYIKQHIDKWNIDFTLNDFQTESEGYSADNLWAEEFMQEAEERPLVMKILRALHKKEGYGFRERNFKGVKYEEPEPSLRCKETKKIISDALDGCLRNLPINTPEKQEEFVSTLVGMMIIAMTYQDKQYSTQPLYSNELLCPNLKYDELKVAESNNIATFQQIGKQVLAGEISFEAKPHPKFFPLLAEIPEVEQLIQLFQSGQQNNANAIQALFSSSPKVIAAQVATIREFKTTEASPPTSPLGQFNLALAPRSANHFPPETFSAADAIDTFGINSQRKKMDNKHSDLTDENTKSCSLM